MDQCIKIYYQSPLGILQIVSDGKHIIAINFVRKQRRSYNNTLLRKCVVQLNQYFLGRRKKFTVPVKLVGTLWQKKVWQKLAVIPYGSVISYQDLAIALGRPKAARAVGQAVGKNPIPIIIPCHRIVALKGLGGYAGGIKRKIWLIKRETLTNA